MTTPKEPRQRRRESISLRLTMLLMPLSLRSRTSVIFFVMKVLICFDLSAEAP